jgi:hypothetical protein
MHGLECTWNVCDDCGHMHGQHATTESTQRHKISSKTRSFIGQRGKAGGMSRGELVLVGWCHLNGGEFGYLSNARLALSSADNMCSA